MSWMTNEPLYQIWDRSTTSEKIGFLFGIANGALIGLLSGIIVGVASSPWIVVVGALAGGVLGAIGFSLLFSRLNQKVIVICIGHVLWPIVLVIAIVLIGGILGFLIGAFLAGVLAIGVVIVLGVVGCALHARVGAGLGVSLAGRLGAVLTGLILTAITGSVIGLVWVRAVLNVYPQLAREALAFWALAAVIAATLGAGAGAIALWYLSRRRGERLLPHERRNTAISVPIGVGTACLLLLTSPISREWSNVSAVAARWYQENAGASARQINTATATATAEPDAKTAPALISAEGVTPGVSQPTSAQSASEVAPVNASAEEGTALSVAAPTYAVAELPTPTAVAELPTPTPEPTFTPEPTPTPLPDTPAGSILKPKESWRQNGMELSLDYYTFLPKCAGYFLEFRFVVKNNTDAEIVTTISGDDFVLSDDTGRTYQGDDVRAQFSECISNVYIYPASRTKISALAPRQSVMIRFFVVGELGKDVNKFVITVAKAGRIRDAVWEIEVPR